MTRTWVLKLMIISGLDAVTFLQFLRLLRWLFVSICIFVAIPLICANYYINTQTTYGSKTSNSTSSYTQSAGTNVTTGLLDNMQLFTAANMNGNILFVHIMFEYITTFLVIFFGKSQHLSCFRID